MENDLEKAIKVLQKPEKLFEDIEFLISYLQQFEELQKYFKMLNPVLLASLCRQFFLKKSAKSEILFEQNSDISSFFLILQGTVSLYDGKKFIQKFGPGKSIGERELIKSSNLRYTGLVSSSDSVILVLSKADFLKYLADVIIKESVDKMSYLKMIVPNLHKLSCFVLEKLMQSIKIQNYTKGEHIVEQGVDCENLVLVADGECALVNNSGVYSKEVVRLAKGSIFGEEGIFYSLPTKFSLIAKSDATIMFIKRADVLTSFPDSVLRRLKSNYEFKKLQRPSAILQNEDENKFPLASTYARKRLAIMVSRSNRLSPSRLLLYHQRKYGDFKEFLSEMRDTSPKRISLPRLRRSNDVNRMAISFRMDY